MQMPEEPCSAPTPPVTLREELEAESPDSPDSQASIASYSLHPRLPITYNEAALSQLQGRPQVIICNNLSIPFPSNCEYSTDDTDSNTTDGTNDTDGSPLEAVADSSHPQRITDSKDRCRHTYPPRCPVDHIPGHTDA